MRSCIVVVRDLILLSNKKLEKGLRDRIAPDEAKAAEHNGDIWSRASTKYGTILAARL